MELADALISGDRAALARAITLAESKRPEQRQTAGELLATISCRTGHAYRIGITGVPGAGKSTFIDALGMHLIGEGHRVAVLTVDPSSPVSGGSILGDKTRMTRLSIDPRAFVRSSPSGGHLGGVGRNTRDAMLLCEAAGYDVVFIETVGSGQSEVEVRNITDFFLLIALAGAGDELQGIKRGVLELVDAIAINKADSGNEQRTEQAKQQFVSALHILRGQAPPVLLTSALTGSGIPETWAAMEQYRNTTDMEGFRASQRVAWMRDMVLAELQRTIEANSERAALEQRVKAGEVDPVAAARELVRRLAQP